MAYSAQESESGFVLGSEAARIEVWPGVGLNCLRWQVRSARSGSWGDLFHVAPDWATNPVPTRSGHPVLFPFPNRLQAGRLNFAGQVYQLPLTESSGVHAIHGFTPRLPWRVVEVQTTPSFASITGAFQISRDVPNGPTLWPGDLELRLTYTLSAFALQVEAVVSNLGTAASPFGLGYHPYFRLPTAPEMRADAFEVQAATGALWATDGGLPTGALAAPPPELDFRTILPIGSREWDHLYQRDALWGELARIGSGGGAGQVVLHADAAFQQVLVFTPPHRLAVAVEPYTCASDAANLTERGVEAGWQTLDAGKQWSATVRYEWHPDEA